MSVFIIVAGISAIVTWLYFVYKHSGRERHQASAAATAPPQLPPLPTLSPFSVPLSLYAHSDDELARPLGAQSSTTTADYLTLRRRPVNAIPLDDNGHSFGFKHHHSPTKDDRQRPDVHGWRNKVAFRLDEERSQSQSPPIESSNTYPASDELKPDDSPTHDITESSVPSTPSSASGARDIVVTLPPLPSNAIPTGVTGGANCATGTGLSNIESAAAASSQSESDGNGDSSSTSQFLVIPHNVPEGGARHLRSSSPLSSPLLNSDQPTYPKSPQPPAPQVSPPQTRYTPPYLLVSSPSPSDVASQSSLDQDQGSEIVSNPTSSTFPFQLPSSSDRTDRVVPSSPGPFGFPGPSSQGSIKPPPPLQSPFILLGGSDIQGGQQQQQQQQQCQRQRRQPLSLLGSAGSVMTTTIRQSSLLDPPISMFSSLSSSSDQTSPTLFPVRLPPPPPPAAQSDDTEGDRPPPSPSPAVQLGDILLSFPSDINQHQPSPGIMSPILSELDFVSEVGSTDGDVGSESSWSSTSS